MIEVCLTIDKNAAESGFVTAFSLLEQAKEKVSIMVCFDREDGLPVTDWSDRLAAHGFDFDLRYQMIDNTAFRATKAMFDSYATYLKLSAPSHAGRAERLLYLDADIVFTGWDLLERIYHMDMGGAAVAMLPSGTCGARAAKEREMLVRRGRKETDLYYGGTLALVDVAKYHELNLLDRYKEVALSDAPSLLYHDQSVANAALANGEATPIPLDPAYREAGRSGPLPEFPPGIIHVCGAPKPWDVFGEWFHPYYPAWSSVAERAGLPKSSWRNYFNPRALKRAWRIRKQYTVWFGPIVDKL